MRNRYLLSGICALPLLAACIASCSQDKIPTFDDVDRICFRYAKSENFDINYPSQLKVNMGYDIPIKNDTIISIPVSLIGNISSVDREIKGELITNESTATEGTDVEIMPSVLPADSITGFLKVKLLHSARTDQATLLARVRLVSNDYFHTDYSYVGYKGDGLNGLVFSLYFDAKMEMPELWADATAGAKLTNYFGAYSNVKYQLILQVCGLTPDFFKKDPDLTADETLTKRLPTGLAWGMIVQLNNYLREHPTVDENGKNVATGHPGIY